jgi:TolB-like protein/class 3 adenylate cyclase/Flp pilus assembly protein TadD
LERKLAVILASDVAGYSRLVAANEESTIATLGIYSSIIGELVAEHGGRVFGSAGDSLVAEFQSAVQSVRAAVAIQRAIQRRNADLPTDKKMEFRLGLNLGDVVVSGTNLLGDGVNVAARIQQVVAPCGICISGTMKEQIDGKLDFPIVRLGEKRLKNIPRSIPLYEIDWRRNSPARSGTMEGPRALPDKPSIVVLPFMNMSDDPEQEFFADGLTEDVITALSLYRWFFVIAQHTSFAYKGRAVDAQQIGRDLGVRYIVEGSVRRAGNRVRVTGQLIEAETGVHLWAHRYDREVADIFAIQDELTQQVVGAIEPEILLGESRRALHRTTDNLDAYECHMRGTWLHNAQDTAEHFEEAISWHRRAIELDPDFGRAHMMLARSLYARCFHGFSDNVDRDSAEMRIAAERAVALDPRDPYSHYAMCLAHFVGRHAPSAVAEAQRAIDLNPNLALAHMGLGWARIFTGHFAEALEPLHMALRLSPYDPLAYLILDRIALAHYHLRQYDQSIHYAEYGLSLRRAYFNRVVLLASLGQLGREEEARRLVPETLANVPADIGHYWKVLTPYVDQSHYAHFLEGLERAGFPVVD